jgi:ribosomal protein S18 acetylase RimI-like enzyme
LIERAEEDLLNKGESKYFLRVNRMNLRAINFYTKVGLKIVGTEGPDTLRMEKALL